MDGYSLDDVAPAAEPRTAKVSAPAPAAAPASAGYSLEDVAPPKPKYETALTPREETKFTSWKAQHAPNDSGEDYDLRGAFKANVTPDAVSGHWPDTYKKPNHPTFSDQSQYAKDAPELAGKWNGETFVPPAQQGYSLDDVAAEQIGTPSAGFATTAGGAATGRVMPKQKLATGSVMDNYVAPATSANEQTSPVMPVSALKYRELQNLYATDPTSIARMAKKEGVLGDAARKIIADNPQQPAAETAAITPKPAPTTQQTLNTQRNTLVEWRARMVTQKPEILAYIKQASPFVGDVEAESTYQRWLKDPRTLPASVAEDYFGRTSNLNPLERGVATGMLNLWQSAQGGAQALSDALGTHALSQRLREEEQRTDTTVKQLGRSPAHDGFTGALKRDFESVIGSVIQQVPALAGGVAFKGADAVVGSLGMLGVQQFGQEYANGTRGGLRPSEAADRAAIFASFEVIGELFGFPQYLAAIKQAVAGVPTRQLVAQLAHAVTADIPGEQLTTLGQFLADKSPHYGLNQAATFSDYMQQVRDTLTQTVMQGGVMGGGSMAIHGGHHLLHKDDQVGGFLKDWANSINDVETNPAAADAAARAAMSPENSQIHVRPARETEHAQDVAALTSLLNDERSPNEIIAERAAAAEATRQEHERATQAENERRSAADAAELADLGVPAAGSQSLLTWPDGAQLNGTIQSATPTEVVFRTNDGETYTVNPRDREADFIPAPQGDGTPSSPIVIEHPAHIEEAAKRIDEGRSWRQIEAGNDRKAHVLWHDVPVTLEVGAGDVRESHPDAPEQWSVEMKHAYGYAKRSKGADGDGVDVFIVGTHPTVHVFDTLNKATGAFDEHKAILGAGTTEDATQALQDNYNDRAAGRIGGVTEMTVPQFRQWLKSGNTTEPVAFDNSNAGIALEDVAIAPAPEPAAAAPELSDETIKRIQDAHERQQKRAERKAAKEKEAQAKAEAKLQRSETARKTLEKRRPVHTGKDSVITAVAKLGGLSMDWKNDILGDKRANKIVPGIGALFNKNGSGVDDMATRLGQYHYLSPQELEDTDGGVQALKDKIRDEFDGHQTHYALGSKRSESPEDKLSRDLQEEADAWFAEHGIEPADADVVLTVAEIQEAAGSMTMTGEDIAIVELIDAARAVDDNAVDDLPNQLEVADYIKALKEIIDGTYKAETQKAESDRAETRADVSAEAKPNVERQEPDAERGQILTSYSLDDVADKAEQAEAGDVEQRRQADREREHFKLQPETPPSETGTRSQGSLEGMSGITAGNVIDNHPQSQRRTVRAVNSLFDDLDDGMKFSLGRQPTDAPTETDAFKEWFGSSMMHVRGTPIVLYHGTQKEFEAFDKQKIGKKAAHITSGLGFFFSPSEQFAKKYADDSGRVLSFYANLKQPFVMPYKDTLNIETHAQAVELRERLQKDGYDGIVIPKNDLGFKGYVIVFEPASIKSTDNFGTFSKTDPRFKYSRGIDDVFYSALARAIDNMPLKSASAQQWKASIKNLVQKGIKQMEIDATGINDWLDHVEYDGTPENKLAKISKENVVYYLKQNGVKVTETILGGEQEVEINVGSIDAEEPDTDDIEQTAKDIYLDEAISDIASEQDMPEEEVDKDDALERAKQRAYDAYYSEPQYSGGAEASFMGATYDYSINISGGEMDIWRRDGKGDSIYTGRPVDNAQIQEKIRADVLELTNMEEGVSTKFDNWKLPGGKDYQELLLTLPVGNAFFELDDFIDKMSKKYGYKTEGTVSSPAWEDSDLTKEERAELFFLQKARTRGSAPQFQSSHFSQDNILAHVRFDERKDADGKRVLFVEEFQSDWAQKGREEGFRNDSVQPQPGAIVEATQAMRDVLNANDRWGFDTIGEAMSAAANHADWADRWDVDTPEQAVIVNRYRDVQLAINAARGIPTAPFVTKTEAWVSLLIKRMIRYAAEKDFDRIAWATGEQNAEHYRLTKRIDEIRFNTMPDGHIFWNAYKNGDRVTGKDTPPDELAGVFGKEIAEKILAHPKEPGVLSGLDLDVGGQGMRSFYDKIVPNVANDVLKKLGGDRVIKVDMSHMHPGTRPTEVALQMGFDITPKLKETALGGMPLFSRGAHFSDRYKANQVEITKRVVELAKQIAPSAHLKVVEQVFASGAGAVRSGAKSGEKVEAAGYYDSLRDLITVALRYDNPAETLRHESFHHLRNMGLLNDGEWDVLAKQAKAEWMGQYGVPDVEEAIAYAFGAYRGGEQHGGRVARIFAKIRQFLQRLANLLHGMGFQTWQDVFAEIEGGKVGRRGLEPAAIGEPQRASIGRGDTVMPSVKEITSILRKHPLVKLREKVKRAFVVGSFAKGGQNADSDVDILLEVEPHEGFTPAELEDHYRQALRQHFVTNNIRGKDDSVHPQLNGRRVDVYFTYDADEETRPKLELKQNEQIDLGDRFATAREQTDSAAFKQWFADSKVVDAEGNPLRVLHGTTQDFAEFWTRQEKIGKTRSTNAGELGSWFAGEPLEKGNYDEGNAEYIASSFTEDAKDFLKFRDGARVMPVYLSIKNPAEFEGYDDLMDERDYAGSWKKLRAKLEDKGHDGLVVRNSMTDGDVDRDDWVAFEPGQIKSAIGNRGTFDAGNPDIRYSAGDDENELIIQHNVTAANVMHADRLGGLAVPSLAITKANDAMTNFGEITLIGDREMANPRGYARTQVFGADIYSPRYPTIHYKFTQNNVNNMQRRLEDAIKVAGNLDWDDVQKRGAAQFENEPAVMWQFLKDRGVEPDVVMEKGITKKRVAELKRAGFEKYFGRTDWQSLAHDEEFERLVHADIQSEYARLGDEYSDLKKTWEELTSSQQVNGSIQHAQAMGKIGAPETINRYATRDALRTQVRKFPEGELAHYAQELFSKLDADEKLFKGFNYNGDRTYKPHTLDNVVRELKRSIRGGEGFNYGLGSARSKVTPQFKSIKEIRSQKDRLVSKEKLDEFKKIWDAQLHEIWNDIAPYHDSGKNFGFGDILVDTLAESNSRGLDYALKDNQFDVERIPDELKDRMREFVDEMREWPTEYFEAKILRAVDLAEFKAAIVPKGADKRVVDVLKAKGLHVAEYNAKANNGDQSDRKRVIDQVTAKLGIRFSLGEQEKAADDANAALNKQPPIAFEREPSPFGGGKLADDINWLTKFAVHPRTIATMNQQFAPVYLAAVHQFEHRDEIAASLQREATPYFDMPRESKERVNAVLELGRLQGKVFGTGTDEVVVTNDTGRADALLAAGETLTLTDREKSGYWAIRRTMDKALGLFKEQVIREWGLDPTKVKSARDIMDALPAGAGDAETARYQQAAMLVREIEEARKRGYIPFNRWGQVGIVVREPKAAEGWDSDGANPTLHFEMIEVDSLMQQAKRALKLTSAEMVKMPEVKARIAALEKLYPEKDVRVMQVSPNTPMAGGVQMTDLDMLAAVSQINEQAWAEVRSGLQSAIQQRGFRKHFFGSANVPGYSQDFERAIADYVVGISGYLARRQASPVWDEAIANIPKEKPSLTKYAQNYREYVNNPVEEFAGLRQAAFFYYLAGVPSTAMINATQVAMITAPFMTQFASAVKVTAELTAAYKDAATMLRFGSDVFNPSSAPDDVREEFQQAWDEGFFVPVTTYEMMGLAHNRMPALRHMAKKARQTLDTVSYLFNAAERTNRVVTFIAAVRMAKQQGFAARVSKVVAGNMLARADMMKEFTPAKFAEFVIDETHFRMGKVNRPQAMRGAGAALLQFKGFTFQAIELYGRLASQNGAQGKKALALMLLMLMMTSGLWGEPFGKNIADLLEFLYKRYTDTDIDLKTKVREFIYDLTGSSRLARAFTDGALSQVIGVDVGQRIGQGGVLPESASDIGGIPLSMTAGKLGQSLDYAQRGQGMLALAEIMPNFIKNPMTAYTWGEEGVKSQSTGKVFLAPESVTTADMAKKAIGFTPEGLSTIREAERAVKRAEHEVDKLRSDYYAKLATIYAKAQRADDAGRTKDSMALEIEADKIYSEIAKFNEGRADHEQVNIDPKTLQGRVREELYGFKNRQGRERKSARDRAEKIREVYGTDVASPD